MRVIQPKNWLLMTATTTNFLASRLSVYPFEKVSLRKSAVFKLKPELND
jgi:hypothetical protein